MQPDPTQVCAIGQCNCGNSVFTIKIYLCGNHREHCTRCGQAWETPFRESPQDTEGDQAVAEVGDVGADLVSPPQGEQGEQVVQLNQESPFEREIREIMLLQDVSYPDAIMILEQRRRNS